MNGAEVWREFISPEIIIELHEVGMDRYGGLKSLPVEGCVERSAGGAYTASLYTAKNNPPTALEIALPFAGYLLFYLAKNHCFSDGNKRVAWTATMHVLAHFGLTLTATQDAAYELVDAVVTGRIEGGADVTLWLEQYLTAIDYES
ncbi:MAG TPA: Fic family protein [Pyrinomonadaceae bacterium]|nr:Fic family protein [Pyrinomonadaceae bacterium]